MIGGLGNQPQGHRKRRSSVKTFPLLVRSPRPGSSSFKSLSPSVSKKKKAESDKPPLPSSTQAEGKAFEEQQELALQPKPSSFQSLENSIL